MDGHSTTQLDDATLDNLDNALERCASLAKIIEVTSLDSQINAVDISVVAACLTEELRDARALLDGLMGLETETEAADEDG